MLIRLGDDTETASRIKPTNKTRPFLGASICCTPYKETPLASMHRLHELNEKFRKRNLFTFVDNSTQMLAMCLVPPTYTVHANRVNGVDRDVRSYCQTYNSRHQTHSKYSNEITSPEKYYNSFGRGDVIESTDFLSVEIDW